MPTITLPTPHKGLAVDPPLGEPALAATLEGFWHHTGRLRSMEGRLLKATVPHVYGVADGEFGNHYVYRNTVTGVRYVVARNGNYIWLGVVGDTTVSAHDDAVHTLTLTDGTNFPLSGSVLVQGVSVVTYTSRSGNVLSGVSALPTSLANGDTAQWVDWRPLWGNSGTGGYAARTAGTDEAFVQLNDLLYFSGGGVPGRWTGFEFHTGTITKTSATRVAGTFTDSGILAGDTIYFKNGTDWDMDHGTIVTAFNNAYLDVVAAPAWISGATPYQVVRTAQMGIPAATALEAVGLDTDGAVPVGTYRYYWRYVSSTTGYKGAMSEMPNSAQSVSPWENASVVSVAASRVIGSGTNGQVTFTAVTAGVAGNSITTRLRVTNFGVWYADVNEYSVYLGSNHRASNIAARVEAHPQVKLIVHAVASGDGSTDVAAATLANLTGGTDTYTGSIYRKVVLSGSWSASRPEPHVTDVEIWRTRLVGIPQVLTGDGTTSEILWTATDPGVGDGGVEITFEPGGEAGNSYFHAKYQNTYISKNLGTSITTATEVAAAVNADSGLSAVVTGDAGSRTGIVDGFKDIPLTGGDEGEYELRTKLTYGTSNIDLGWTDDGTIYANTYDLETDYLYYDRPGSTTVGDILRFHGDRLMTAPPSEPGSLRFSTLGDHEYWPNSGVGNYGGTVVVSTTADPIVDMVTEGGSFADTGVSGHSLLIQTRTKSVRFFGSAWSGDDVYSLVEAFPVGSAAKTAKNLFGSVFWMSPDGPMRLTVGSQQPEPIYRALWPYGLRSGMPVAVASQPALLAKWRSCVYGEYWLLSGNDGVSDKLYAYHVPSGSWSTLPLSTAIHSFATWDETGQITAAEDSLYRMFAGAGVETLDARAKGSCWIPLIGGVAATYQAINWKTGPVLPRPTEGFSRWAKIIQVAVRFRKPTASQSVTLSVFANNDLTTAQWSETKTVSSNADGEYVVATWYPQGGRGFQFNFGLSGTLTRPLECEEIEFTYLLQERQK